MLDIKELLELAYNDFHNQYHRQRDPISRVHQYRDPRDQEIAALFSALISYGNVTSILKSVDLILSQLSPSPACCLLRGQFPPNLRTFRHRFTTGIELEILFHWVSTAIKESGSVENFFIRDQPELPVKALITSFVTRLMLQPIPRELQQLKERRLPNLKYLLSDPLRGSACKRMNMFLRWMVRGPDEIDLGIWESIRPERLMLPIDTHLLKTLRRLGWTQSKQATWKVVEQATKRLRKIMPADPIRYDFALCHLSMVGRNIREYPHVRSLE